MSTTLRDQTVILDMIFHRPGTTRRDHDTEINTEANPNWLSVLKTLFKSDKFNKCATIQHQVKTWLRKRAVPSGLEGYYVIPLSSLSEVYDYLDAADKELLATVDEFCGEYDAIVANAKENLKDMFDDKRYPPVDYFRRGVSNERKLVELGVPEPAKVGEAIYKAERAKAEAMWAEEEQAVTYAMREQFRALVAHLADKLDTTPGGEKKVLKDAALNNLLEWMDLFSRRNVLNDIEMASLVDWSKKVLAGIDPEVVRKNEKAKSILSGAMNKVIAKLDILLVNAPKRKIIAPD